MSEDFKMKTVGPGQCRTHESEGVSRRCEVKNLHDVACPLGGVVTGVDCSPAIASNGSRMTRVGLTDSATWQGDHE